jgi:hypothetical protein
MVAMLGTTVSCAPEPSKLQQAMLAARKAQWSASECARDSMLVPFEHSGNCVAAMRILRSNPGIEECNDNAGLHCREIERRLGQASGWLWRATAHSLFAFGAPKHFNLAKRGTWFGVYQFYDVDLLAKAYQDCLASETGVQAIDFKPEQHGSKSQIIRASIVQPRRLADGQKCIRERPMDSKAGWLDS